MSKAKRSWREKLEDDKGLPRVERIEGGKTKRWGEGTFVISAPREVDACMREVPFGKLLLMDDLRAVLASRHGTSIACPLTTGIFAWIAAHAAAEAIAAGGEAVTPYWRTLKVRGEVNPKYPGGVEDVARRLESEGHRVEQRGKRYFVVGYERARYLPS
jgi:hypothetical protein